MLVVVDFDRRIDAYDHRHFVRRSARPLDAQRRFLPRLQRPFDPGDVDDVIAGCVSQVGEQGSNLARNAVLTAGWPYQVSAVSLNRFCASGLQAIHFGAMGVGSGAHGDHPSRRSASPRTP